MKIVYCRLSSSFMSLIAQITEKRNNKESQKLSVEVLFNLKTETLFRFETWHFLSSFSWGDTTYTRNSKNLFTFCQTQWLDCSGLFYPCQTIPMSLYIIENQTKSNNGL